MYPHCIQKKYKTYKVTFKKEKIKVSKTPEVKINESYIPKGWRPKWCLKNNKKRVPQYKCMDCPFFACTNADRKDYVLFDKAWRMQDSEDPTMR